MTAVAGVYFKDKPEVDIPDNAVLSFSCMKNELPRLEYFLQYYRDKGVHSFFIVDNNSTDGSYEYLLTQPDVVVFRSLDSYKGSGAGRDLVHELCAHYGIGHWCLTLDVDELLYYPGAEHVSLPTLCEYLDAEQAEGLFTVFLDLYSDKPVSDTPYESGTPFTETCPFYETDSYVLDLSEQAPHVAVFGGPRWRVFWNANEDRRGPAMRKVPLVKWKEGFRYLYSTHSHTDIELASITGVLAHFKFFSLFTDRVEADNSIGDRRQTNDYKRYQTTLSEDPVFLNPSSKRFTDSRDFCRDGLFAISRSYREFVEPIFKAARVNPDSHMPASSSAGVFGQSEQKFTISAIRHLWPFFTAQRVAAERMSASVRQANPQHRVNRAAKAIGIEWLNERELCLLIPEAAWADSQRFDTTFQLLTEERGLVAKFTLTDFERVDRSVIPNLYCVPVPADLPRTELDIELMFASDWFVPVTSKIANRASFDNAGYDGVIETVDGSIVTGWIHDTATGSWWHPVGFFADGFYLGRSTPTTVRRDLGASGETARSFTYTVPLGFLRHQPDPTAPIAARSAMGDYELAGSPVIFVDDELRSSANVQNTIAAKRNSLGRAKNLAESMLPESATSKLKSLARKLL